MQIISSSSVLLLSLIFFHLKPVHGNYEEASDDASNFWPITRLPHAHLSTVTTSLTPVPSDTHIFEHTWGISLGSPYDPNAQASREAFERLMEAKIRAVLQDEIESIVQDLTMKALDQLSPQFPLLFAHQGSRYLCHNIVSIF